MSELPSPSDFLALALRIDQHCDAFEEAWITGAPLGIEGFLERVPADDHLAITPELVSLEIFHRLKRGEKPTATEYQQRFPQLPLEFIAAALAQRDSPLRSHGRNASLRSSQRLSPVATLPFVPGKQAEDLLPEVFGRYCILRLLGKGAMGIVYLARDTHLERDVALKVPQLSGPDQSQLIARFYRDARASATLRHPHICPVFDVGQLEGRHFITMAFIDGRPLSNYISQAKPQKPPAAALLVRKIALGLQEAHRHGIVHRDLKPGNVMIDGRGEPTVMDFGLARDFSQVNATRMTQTGMIVGTPAYMSPEQIEGNPAKIGAESDIWSLGVIFYEVLTGQMPFPGGTVWKVISNIQHIEPTPLTELRPDLPARLVAICEKMLEKKVADRYRTMAQVAIDLGRFLKDPQPRAVAVEPAAPPPPVEATSVPSLIFDPRRLKADVPPQAEPQAGDRSRTWIAACMAGGAATLLVLVLLVGSLSGWPAVGKTPEKAPPQQTAPQEPGTPVWDDAETDAPPEKTPPPPTFEPPTPQPAVEVPTPPPVEAPVPPEPVENPLIPSEPEPEPPQPVPAWPADAPLLAVAPFDAKQAQEHQAAWGKYLGVPVEYKNDIGMKFRLIPPGRFTMGSTEAEIEELIASHPSLQERSWDIGSLQSENPTAVREVATPFYMGIHEVTVGQFRRFAQAESYQTVGELKGGGTAYVVEKNTIEERPEFVWDDPKIAVSERHPVRFMTQEDARQFHNWLEQTTRVEYDLATEPQWEFACRGGTVTKWHFGNKEADLARFDWVLPDGMYHAVGLKPANPFGLHDLYGNVSELALDRKPQSILRGGDKGSEPFMDRSAHRHRDDFSPWEAAGFRSVASVESVKRQVEQEK